MIGICLLVGWHTQTQTACSFPFLHMFLLQLVVLSLNNFSTESFKMVGPKDPKDMPEKLAPMIDASKIDLPW